MFMENFNSIFFYKTKHMYVYLFTWQWPNSNVITCIKGHSSYFNAFICLRIVSTMFWMISVFSNSGAFIPMTVLRHQIFQNLPKRIVGEHLKIIFKWNNFTLLLCYPNSWSYELIQHMNMFFIVINIKKRSILMELLYRFILCQ